MKAKFDIDRCEHHHTEQHEKKSISKKLKSLLNLGIIGNYHKKRKYGLCVRDYNQPIIIEKYEFAGFYLGEFHFGDFPGLFFSSIDETQEKENGQHCDKRKNSTPDDAFDRVVWAEFGYTQD